MYVLHAECGETYFGICSPIKSLPVTRYVDDPLHIVKTTVLADWMLYYACTSLNTLNCGDVRTIIVCVNLQCDRQTSA